MHLTHTRLFSVSKMAVAVTKALVGSKVKGITKDIEGAVGLGDDEEETSKAAAEYERKKLDQDLKRRQEQRKREMELVHAEKERERQKIREKYKLPDHSKKSKGASSQPKRSQDSAEKDSKCLIS